MADAPIQRDEQLRDAASRAADDAFLLTRLVAGDDAALGELYDAYADVVYGVARRVTADAAAADDVTQDVFVQVWQDAHRIDLSRCSLRGWLSVLAHRRAVDCVRRTERARRRDERAAQVHAHSPAVDLADWATSRDEASRARAALASLPPEQRQAIELAFWHGRTYREVAIELGIPEGTAKSRLRLGLARLAALLEETLL